MVKRLNRKMLVLIAVSVSILMTAPLASAKDLTVQAWTDRTEYYSGDSGTLYLTFLNSGDSALTIKKVTLIYEEWHVFRNGQWEGNQTIILNQPVAANGASENSTGFTVPTDGRAITTDIRIEIQTAESGTVVDTFHSITVAQTPRYADQIVTMLTILSLLVIIGALIIAGTIFLSARRPQVMWKTEEGQQ